MGEPNASVNISPIPSFCREKSFIRQYQAIDDAIRRDDELYLRGHLKEVASKKHEGRHYSAVNLSGDSLISVLIYYEKAGLAIKLLDYVDEESLLAASLKGNTALHVAAVVGDKVMNVAHKLIIKNKKLLDMRNEDQETPLLKAALNGQRNIFRMIYDLGDDKTIIEVKRKDGANVLHCAIMGNAPRLALDIAKEFPHLSIKRNAAAVTPLQLLVTLPGAFKSKMEFGPLESFIYKCISLHEKERTGPPVSSATKNAYDPSLPAAEKQQDEENQQLEMRKSFPRNYATMFNLFKLIKTTAGWVKQLIFNILKQMFPTIEHLEKLKKHHIDTMALIECLAGDVEYWEFIELGKTGQFDESRSFNTHKLPEVDMPSTSEDFKEIYGTGFQRSDTGLQPSDTGLQPSADTGLQRWNDSPLIIGAKMGLHEFVDKILEVYPQSVNILDAEGQNIIQVAISLESKNIFKLVASKLTSSNPLLPSRLLYARDKKNNTILHYAANVTVDEKLADALQMQKDLQWFEDVEKLMPRDLQYSRNREEQTAQERFSATHKEMASKGKEQLTQLGTTCSGLVAAFVFASSFSIPASSNDSGGGGNIYGKAAFGVFENAFVFGLSCAATALVLFLLLANSSYREREFRRSLPTKVFFAVLSFILALISLLVAFACNIFLQIYSHRRIGAKELIPFVCELTLFPALTLFVLLYRGCSFGIISFLQLIWR